MTDIRVPDADWKTWAVTLLIAVVVLVGGWVYTEQSGRLERLQNEIMVANATTLDHERRLVALEVRFEEIVKKLNDIHADVKKLQDR